MQKFALACALIAVVGVSDVAAQTRRGAAPQRGGNVTLAINVTDPDGKGIPNVRVQVEGPATRTTRTEGGRIALEGLPAGAYRIRFERDGFVTLERELSARAGQVVDVKVTMNPVPPPPAPPEPPPPPPKPAYDATAVAIDILQVIDKEFVGRAAGRTTPLSCSGEVESTLIQLNQPLAEHAHENADEVFYVIAGEGTARFDGQQHRLKAGVYLFIPRGTLHTLTQSGRNPLIVLSTRSGAPCQ